MAGEHLIAHPDVSMVSFTGSTPIGQRVMTTAAGTVKRVHLELGGKAPFVVFDDADLDAAIHGAVTGGFINTGQDCTAATRAYVQRASCTRTSLRPRNGRMARRFTSATPRDSPTSTRAPLIRAPAAVTEWRASSSGHAGRRKVVAAASVPGGDPAWPKGSYLPADGRRQRSAESGCVQMEIFGPVLIVLPFDKDDKGAA